MKRLLRIGLNSIIQSLIPILCWFLLGFTINASIVNVFSITYPIQFVASIIKEIFGTGANIKKEKENNPNAVPSGIVLGSLVGAVVFGVICSLVTPYLKFMSMEVEIYKTFVLFSFIQMYISLVFQLIIEKLYFEDKDKSATIYTIIFNVINLAMLVGTSLITKNQIVIIVVTLVVLSIFTLGVLFSQFTKFKLDFNILTNFKYESNELVAEIFLFIIYFFGLSNVFSAGEQYLIAINFVTLVTDTQWDACYAMSIVSKIDTTNNNFNIKKHFRNGLLFICLLALSSLIAFFALFNLYNVNLKIGLCFLTLQLTDFFLASAYYILGPYIQLKHSAFKNTTCETFAYACKGLIAMFLPTVFRLDIAQLTASTISIIFYIIIFAKYFKVNKDGTILNKPKKEKQNPENK